MGDRVAKDALFDGFADVAKALANGRRAELIDVLAQGERHVEELADEIGQSVANTSFHLRTLAGAGLVVTRRDKNRIYYRLASDRVIELWSALRDVAAAHHAELDALAAAYLGHRDELDQMSRAELAARLAAGDVDRGRRPTVGRVRGRSHRRRPFDPRRPPRPRAAQPARRRRDRRLLPRPVLRARRRRRPPAAPPRARRAPPRGRLPRMAPREPAHPVTPPTGGHVMKILVILQGPAYGTEASYNGLRLAGNLAKRDGVEVKIFCFGDAVGLAVAGQQLPNGYYHLDRMLTSAARHGAEIGLCGTCMDARGITDAMLIAEARRSSLDEVTDWTLWADKTIAF